MAYGLDDTLFDMGAHSAGSAVQLTVMALLRTHESATGGQEQTRLRSP